MTGITLGAALTPMAAQIAGVHGRVVWGYFDAARITRYALVRTSLIPETWRLTATVVQPDTFKLRQVPLMFVAWHQGGEWRWPIVEVITIERDQLTAQLGPAAP